MRLFWIENDPPPLLELFRKFIRFGDAILPLLQMNQHPCHLNSMTIILQVAELSCMIIDHSNQHQHHSHQHHHHHHDHQHQHLNQPLLHRDGNSHGTFSGANPDQSTDLEKLISVNVEKLERVEMGATVKW